MVKTSGSVVTEVQLTVTVVFASHWVGVTISNAWAASGAATRASKLAEADTMSRRTGRTADVWGVREQ